ncbi:MAG: MFS transporter [Gammaproteobacteria bacterium]|nr:MFS transporter [Gammaproteobacteria bacterium]
MPAWALYDWANSAFATLIQTFVFAAYFTRQVAADETTGTAQWGYATAAAAAVIALGGPVLGAVVDQGGRRKPYLGAFTALGVAATAGLWFVGPGGLGVLPALVLVAVATVGVELAIVFYNAMLADLAPPGRIGRWSGWGWGLGYLGGLACLLVALFGFIEDPAWLDLNREDFSHVRGTFLLTAVWLAVFSVPLFILTPDRPALGKSLRRAVVDGVRQLADSLARVRAYATIVRFLIARMLFVDGLATLFAFGGVFAAGTFDMDERQVLLFGIALNATAGAGAFAFGWFDDRVGSRATMLAALAGLILTGSALLLVADPLWFWLLGMTLGIFVGPAQAASRAYLARAAPAELRTEMFGLFALSGKATAFLGPLLVGWITVLASSQRVGMATIIVFFAAGAALLLTVPEQRPER